MAKVMKWLRGAADRLLDPKREDRIQSSTLEINRRLFAERNGFEVKQVLADLQLYDRDAVDALMGAYSINVDKVFSDNRVDDKERKALRWISSKLGLSEAEAREVEIGIARNKFETLFSRACMDGVIDEDEEASLLDIAKSIGVSTRDFLSDYLNDAGEAFVRGLLSKQMNRGTLDEDSWHTSIESAKRLGLHETEVKLLLEPQVERFVEHVLADAKSDDKIEPSEKERIEWLLRTFRVSSTFRRYVDAQVQQLQEYTDVLGGKLPIVQPIGVALKAGEIAHFQSQGKMQVEKLLKSGPRIDTHHGIGTITDNRFIFSSATRSVECSHRRVIDLIWKGDYLELRSSSKGTGVYTFGSRTKLAAAVYQSAVLMVNQTLVRQSTDGNQRSIPRDVRQRIWQQYGGRCADCQSNQYLEFDHIVPVAKGGSNSDNNVQLLCRGCNIKKSDRI